MKTNSTIVIYIECTVPKIKVAENSDVSKQHQQSNANIRRSFSTRYVNTIRTNANYTQTRNLLFTNTDALIVI